MKKALLIIFGFCSLSIFAQCKQCDSFEEAMKAPKEVMYLKSSSENVGITQVPNGIGELTNLETLILVDQKISSLPAGIGNLEKLTVLAISGSDLTELPASFFKLQNLMKVYLVDNKFSDEYKAKLKAHFAKESPRTSLRL